MRAAGVPARQAQAAWSGDQRPAQCPDCGAFLARHRECLSPRCALQRLLNDCPALNRADLAPDDAQAVEEARATLARVDTQAAQALRLLLDCPALNADGLWPEELAAVEAARGVAGLSAARPPELAQGDGWDEGEKWKELRGQILEFARDKTPVQGDKATSDSDKVSLAGFPQRRSLPRGCWLDSKEIRGHGPYLYLRWRAGSRQRSKYLGKGKVSNPSPTQG
jgi:hypothetical protein